MCIRDSVEAAKIFRKHLNPFVQFNQAAQGVPVVEEVEAIDAAAERRKERLTTLLGEPVERLDLSTRARNCLEQGGVTTLGELVDYTGEDLLAFKNLGLTVLVEIEKKLAELDLVLGAGTEEAHQEA